MINVHTTHRALKPCALSLCPTRRPPKKVRNKPQFLTRYLGPLNMNCNAGAVNQKLRTMPKVI